MPISTTLTTQSKFASLASVANLPMFEFECWRMISVCVTFSIKEFTLLDILNDFLCLEQDIKLGQDRRSRCSSSPRHVLTPTRRSCHACKWRWLRKLHEPTIPRLGDQWLCHTQAAIQCHRIVGQRVLVCNAQPHRNRYSQNFVGQSVLPGGLPISSPLRTVAIQTQLPREESLLLDPGVPSIGRIPRLIRTILAPTDPLVITTARHRYVLISQLRALNNLTEPIVFCEWDINYCDAICLRAL